jgi:hypothetical protein
VNVVQKGNPFSGPLRPRPVREAFSRRANHQFTLVVLIFKSIILLNYGLDPNTIESNPLKPYNVNG